MTETDHAPPPRDGDTLPLPTGPRPDPDHLAWLLSGMPKVGRTSVDIHVYDALRAEVNALLAHVRELRAAHARDLKALADVARTTMRNAEAGQNREPDDVEEGAMHEGSWNAAEVFLRKVEEMLAGAKESAPQPAMGVVACQRLVETMQNPRDVLRVYDTPPGNTLATATAKARDAGCAFVRFNARVYAIGADGWANDIGAAWPHMPPSAKEGT